MVSARIAAASALVLALGALPGACHRDRYIDPHVSCASGTCMCVGGFESCDDDDDNGCETDLQTDLQHCGSCGNACPASAPCSAGTCVCPGGGTACNGSCVDTQTDVENCGSCGAACTNGVCSGGMCACQSGFVDCDADPSTGCETEVADDPDHCGTCGHGCAGGQCAAGVCQPVTFGGTSDAKAIAVAGGQLFVAQCGDPAITQQATSGGAITGIGMTTGCPTLIAATSDTVFWAGEDHFVYLASLLSPATATTIAMDTLPASYMAAGPQHLYWYSDGPSEKAILRVANGAVEKQIVKPPSGFAADAAGVYWGDADGIHVWSVDSPTLYTDINPLVVRGLAVSDTVLFAGTASDGIKSLPVAPGGVVTTLVADALALALAADAAHVYWAEESDGSVRRVKRDGTGLTVLTTGETFAPAEVPFAVDDEAVYWVAGGKVRKVAK